MLEEVPPPPRPRSFLNRQRDLGSARPEQTAQKSAKPPFKYGGMVEGFTDEYRTYTAIFPAYSGAACVYLDLTMSCQGMRRTRKLCRAQQRAITRSRTPAFHKRIQSVSRGGTVAPLSRPRLARIAVAMLLSRCTKTARI